MRRALVFIILGWTLLAHADTISNPSGEKKKIEFEDAVIESVQRQRLEYLGMPDRRDKRGKIQHLYRKRKDFDDKTVLTSQDLGSSP